jgi:ribulose-5-phosphate 4-epimerase/fuculose-1-phosphate aldolase
MEVYIGTKFRTVVMRPDPPRDEVSAELLEWCRRWAAAGYIGKAMGNLSARGESGFFITPTGSDPSALKADDLVHVVTAEMAPPTLTVAGKHEPSSESLMHAAIYAARPAIGAVFHGHCNKMLEEAGRLGLPVTPRERPYGTPAMADAVLDVLSGHAVVIMRNHGFVALGRTMAAANAAVERVMAKL